jgi:nucleoside 2-deoxyribosyltransferase
MKYIYCSGPLFCPEETAGMAAIAKVLEDVGFTTFLPQRDGIERFVTRLINTPLNTNIFGSRRNMDKAIFALDVYQIVKRCDCLVFNMNGRVPDEGAVAEAGIAFAAGKPVVIYKNDVRTIFKGGDNSMITGLSAYPTVRNLKKLPEVIKEITPSQTSITGRLLEIVNYGEKIWSFLKMLPSGRLNKKQQEDMINDIIKISENSVDN